MQTNTFIHPNIQGVSFLCVNLKVLKTTTNIYHPNTTYRALEAVYSHGPMELTGTK
jgi:hypothetical protein